MLAGPDKYSSMTALYDDPLNVEGTTYGKTMAASRVESNSGRTSHR
jgi:hypothetical protein